MTPAKFFKSADMAWAIFLTISWPEIIYKINIIVIPFLLIISWAEIALWQNIIVQDKVFY